MVFNRPTRILSSTIIAGNSSNNRNLFEGGGGTNLRIINDGIIVNTNPDFALNTWGVITMIFDGANSLVRTNLSVPSFGTVGIINPLGLVLATDKIIIYANVKIAYNIIRSTNDPIWLQNNFINWLKNRFAI